MSLIIFSKIASTALETEIILIIFGWEYLNLFKNLSFILLFRFRLNIIFILDEINNVDINAAVNEFESCTWIKLIFSFLQILIIGLIKLKISDFFE